MAEVKTIKIDVETSGVHTLKEQLEAAKKSVQDLADKFGTSSKEVADAADQVRGLEKEIRQTNKTLKALGIEGKFTAITGSITGALNGVEALHGSLGLLGIESENVEKALLKVQSAMALADGVEGIFRAQSSFKRLKDLTVNAFQGMTAASKTFMLTGIGVLIAAIGVLITKWDDIKDALRPATTEAKKFEKSTRESAEAARAALENFDEYERTLKRLGYTEDQIASKRKQRFKEAIDQTRKEIKAAEQVYKSQKENLKTVAMFDALGLNATGRALFGDEEEAKAQRKRIKQLREDLSKVQNDDYEFRQKQKQAKEEEKKQAEEDKKQRQKEAGDKAKEAKDKRAEELAQLAEYNREATDLFKSEYEKQVRDIQEKYAKQIALAKKYKQDTTALEAAQTQELEDALDKSMKPMETLSLQKVQIQKRDLGILKGSVNEELQIKQEAADLELLQLQVKAQRAAQIEAKSQSFKIKSVQDGLSAIASITDLFGKKSEKAAKRAFQIQKAANMASTLISTYQNATAAYASQFTPLPTPDSPIRGGIAAGIAVATGLANVAKIGQQKFESPSSSSGGGGGGGGGVGGGVISPNFNVVGNSGMNQLAQIQQQPIQAYVVSGEVTSAQALDRNRIKNATL
jgi:hypothetical protein